MLVLLGLKPVGAYMRGAFGCYQVDYRYNFFPLLPGETDLGFPLMLDIDGGYIWNPDLVEQVLQDNQLLLELVHQDMIAAGRSLAPLSLLSRDEDNFPAFMRFLSRNNNHMVLEGLLLGFPKQACELFATYYPRVTEAVEAVWNRAKSEGRLLSLDETPSLLKLGKNEKGCRDEFISLGREFGVNEEILTFVLTMRGSNSPGYPYITLNGLTDGEEKELTDRYIQSRVDYYLKRSLSNG